MKSTRLLMACAALVCLLVIAVQPQGDAKHFTKDGLLFDYAKGWEVTDASNARIPGVTVRAMNTATGEVLTAVTNESGAYAFSNVKAGTYRMSASLPGFPPSGPTSPVTWSRPASGCPRCTR